MKKIKEAASDYAIHEYWGICEIVDCDGLIDKSADDFKAGVEFAQRWIPIEEEEPPLYITVLVKLFNGRYFTAKYIKSSKCREDDVWSDGFSYYPVNYTHWRHINIK